MIYDLVIFDDDVSIHCPDHFFDYCGADTRYLGYSTTHTTLANFSSHIYSSNFIIRRLFKFFKFLRLKSAHKWSSSILIYDDIVFALLLKVLGYKYIFVRITHPKDLERMPSFYVTIIHILLKYCIPGQNISTISPLLRRYYRKRFKLYTNFWPSKVAINNEKSWLNKGPSVVYSGTLKGRGSISNLINIMDQLYQLYNVTNLYILAPEIPNKIQNEISKFCEKKKYKIIHLEQATKTQIIDIYNKVTFGLAYYDVNHNKYLKQNFPLKTLEYINYGILPVCNPINAHIYLKNQGLKMILTHYNKPELLDWFSTAELNDIRRENYDLLSKNKILSIPK
jgi:hypothetical protein